MHLIINIGHVNVVMHL